MLGAKLIPAAVEKLKDAQGEPRKQEHEAASEAEECYLLTDDCDDPGGAFWVCEERRRIGRLGEKA